MTSADDAGVVEDMKDVLDFIIFMIIFIRSNLLLQF